MAPRCSRWRSWSRRTPAPWSARISIAPISTRWWWPAAAGSAGITLDGVEVHYTDAYSAYGPIVAAKDGIAWFTLRNAWDPGARYMTESRAELRAARAENHQHREAVAGAIQPLSDAALAALARVICQPILGPGPDGLATWHCKLPPSAKLRGPDPATGGGQFWIVLAGSLSADGAAPLPPQILRLRGAGRCGARHACGRGRGRGALSAIPPPSLALKDRGETFA